ncbi:MAG: hypothetical protein HXN76_09495 [Prevotella pallens]|nr:hypothetical protein [Prevotella pallens]
MNRLRNGREEDERNGGIGNQKCAFQSVIFNVPTTVYKELIVFQQQNHDQ